MKTSKGMLATFLTPALLIFAVVFLYPILRTLVMSFFYVDNVTAAVSKWQFVGFDNFTKLLNTALFKTSLLNLLKIWFFGGLGVMALALLFAVILNSGIKFKRTLRAIIYMPNVISAVALATMWLQYVYNNRFGLLTTLFKSLGLEAAIQWTGPEFKFGAMLIAYCFGMVGYHMLIFSSGIEKIPAEYFEASRIDGAGRIRQFFRITLPLIKGVIKTNITMWSVTSVGFFVWSQLFSNVTADTATITPYVYMYLQTFGSGNTITDRNAGLGAAVGIVLSILVVAVFVITTKLLKDDDLEF